MWLRKAERFPGGQITRLEHRVTQLMTIFGFNTDVKFGDVVYHVQSEARTHDLLLQTLVFSKGQCVHKRAFSYAENTLRPDFSEDAMHELLKIQHKAVIDAVNQGSLEALIAAGRE